MKFRYACTQILRNSNLDLLFPDFGFEWLHPKVDPFPKLEFPSFGKSAYNGILILQKLFQVLAAMVCLDSMSSVSAHIGDRVYPIIEISDDQIGMIDLHDGFVDEWLDVIGPPTLTALDFTALHGSGYQPHDLDFRIWIGWNKSSNRVYVAGQFVDDSYMNSFPAMWWDRFGHHDAMAFMVDGDHSGGVLEMNSRAAQRYEAISHVPAGPTVGIYGVTLGFAAESASLRRWPFLPPYSDGGGGVVGENPTVWVIEFYVTPFDWLVLDFPYPDPEHADDPNYVNPAAGLDPGPESSMVSHLQTGKIIGFNISVSDDDIVGTSDRTEYKLLAFESPFSADTFVDGLLVGSDGNIPGDTAVESVTWGRIKASLFE